MAPHIPPEILQTIFRNLGFFDLLRCQRVCKAWAGYLPGDDPELHRKLFSKAEFAEQEEEDEEPRFSIKMKAPVDVLKIEGMLPKLAFGLEIKVRSPSGFDEDTIFHPLVRNLAANMNLISPGFKLPRGERYNSDGELSTPYFAFRTFEELREKTCMPKGYKYKDGSWRNMLMCVPAIEQVQVHFEWPLNGYHRMYTIEKRLAKGVTVRQFAGAVRRMLARAEDDVTRLSGRLSVYCENCGMNEDAECELSDDDDYSDW
ncbi:uncharacterized protein K460DRAFT_410184 [Cucurbitaria berberidis CBS 394.84]|uniref:F-box domain-containing protein n=1 Tax=Cucurbitaria berberidis CBS 394.84 TaxID=1168544 RepID=A0A9P4L4D3_9PLEO|nr:uncharacterized protein K460DRAFT_410184 [Cucurbitaria berberidis CBS 394.84]KAF1840773.1 hypothetical protein K460DRAFT_410184 [Cucurbitaria berberidis CBS 394.84]